MLKRLRFHWRAISGWVAGIYAVFGWIQSFDWVYQHWPRQLPMVSVPPGAATIAFPIVFVIGVALILWDRHRGRLEPTILAHGIVQAQKRPDGTTAGPDGPCVILEISIVNKGQPVGVKTWGLKVRMPDGNQFDGTAVKFPARWHLMTSKGLMTVRAEDALYEKALHPIATGTDVRGYLIFELGDLKYEKLSAPGNAITLAFKDILGRKYKALSVTADGDSDDFGYLPGTSSEFSSPPPAPVHPPSRISTQHLAVLDSWIERGARLEAGKIDANLYDGWAHEYELWWAGVKAFLGTLHDPVAVDFETVKLPAARDISTIEWFAIAIKTYLKLLRDFRTEVTRQAPPSGP